MSTPNSSTPARTAADIEAELQAIDTVDAELVAAGNGEATTGTATGTPADAATVAAEAEASRKGWIPKDKYKGDPAKWVDAKTFNERGERFTKNLQRDVEQLKQKLADFEGTKKAFVKFHEETMAAKEAELKSAIAALRVDRTRAIREGEDDLAVELEDRIDLLKDQQKAIKDIPAGEANAGDPAAAAAAARKPGPNMDDPVLLDWIADGNEWFQDDPKLRDYSIAIGEDLIAKGETVRGRKFLDKIAGIMAEEFPRRFAAKTQTASRESAVESGTGASSAAAGRTERDLPPEDRALMREFIAAGWTTREKFLKEYAWEPVAGKRSHR